MAERLANNAQTTLVDPINDVDDPAVFNVAVPDRFPDSGNFRVIVDGEIMLVTAVDGNEFTATRAQEGTDIATHAAGAKITHILTAGGNQQFVDDRILTKVPSQSSNEGRFLYTDGTDTSWKYAMSIADVPPSAPGVYDEEFDGPLNTLPTDWAWTSAPSGSDAWYVNKPALPSWLFVYGTGNTNYVLTRSNFTASGDFGVWAKIISAPVISNTQADFRMYLHNSGLTEGRCIEAYSSAYGLPAFRALRLLSSVESSWSATGGGYAAGAGNTISYIGLTRTSNSWQAWGSSNGIGWTEFGAAESHSFTLDKITFTMGTTSRKSSCGIDWLRYRSDTDFPIH